MYYSQGGNVPFPRVKRAIPKGETCHSQGGNLPFPRGKLAIPKGGACHSRPSSSPFTNEEQAVCDNCDNCDSLFFTPKGIERGIEIKRIADIMINDK